MRGVYITLLFLFFIPSVYAVSPADVELLIQKTVPNANIGIALLDAETGEVFYERRAQEPFTPASTTKLFTAAASLLSLGENYRFETNIQIKPNQLQKGKLSGDLYITFSGDPSLNTSDLRQLITQVKHSGVREIVGSIVVDNTRFQGSNFGPGWSVDSLPWYYSAPVTTVILNENQIALNLTSNKVGKKARVKLASNGSVNVNLRSDVVSVSEAEAKLCEIEVTMDPRNNTTIKGCWPARLEDTILKVALKNPNVLMQKVLLQALTKEGILLAGTLQMNKTPPGLKTIASHHSKPLSVLLKKVLQDSNNLYTESLTKTLGADRFGKGTFQMGTLAIKEILTDPTGIDFDELRLEDGSGLSRYNSITPHHFAKLLFAMNHSKVFKESLPLSGGNDSSLNARLRSPKVHGRIRAKTGWMSGVSTLAGYASTLQNKALIFVVMMNNSVHESEKIRQFETELCQLFVTTDTFGK